MGVEQASGEHEHAENEGGPQAKRLRGARKGAAAHPFNVRDEGASRQKTGFETIETQLAGPVIRPCPRPGKPPDEGA